MTITIPSSGTREAPERRLSQIPATAGELAGASFKEAWHTSITPSWLEGVDLKSALAGDPVPVRRGHFDNSRAGQPTLDKISAEDARRRIEDEGLTGKLEVPDTGIYDRALDILVRTKREELQRQSVFARDPGGIGSGAVKLGASLAAGLLDPVNVASAFIPVVGEERAAAIVAKAGASAGAAGRLGARAGIGFVEGSAGAALGEPIIYSAAQQRQADYDANDSLYALAFGGAFGGLLHGVGGAVGDRLRPRSLPDVTSKLPVAARKEVLQGAIASVIEDRPVRAVEALDAMAKTDQRVARALQEDLPGPTARPDALPRVDVGNADERLNALTAGDEHVPDWLPDDHPLVQSYLEDVRALKRGDYEPKKSRSLLNFIKDQGGIINRDKEGRDVAASLKDMKTAPGVINNVFGRNADDIAQAAWDAGYIGHPGGERPDLQELYDAIESEARGNRVYPKQDIADIHDQVSTGEGIARQLEEVGADGSMPVIDQARLLAVHHMQTERAPAYAGLPARDERPAFSDEAIERAAEYDAIPDEPVFDLDVEDTFARLDRMHIDEGEKAALRQQIVEIKQRADDWGRAALEASECIGRFGA